MRLKDLLQEKGMTQRELADRTGLTEATISRYVNGTRRPRGEALLNIALTLGVTTDYLLEASDLRVWPEEKNEDKDYYTALKAIARSGTKWDRRRIKNLVETLVEIL